MIGMGFFYFSFFHSSSRRENVASSLSGSIGVTLPWASSLSISNNWARNQWKSMSLALLQKSIGWLIPFVCSLLTLTPQKKKIYNQQIASITPSQKLFSFFFAYVKFYPSCCLTDFCTWFIIKDKDIILLYQFQLLFFLALFFCSSFSFVIYNHNQVIHIQNGCWTNLKEKDRCHRWWRCPQLIHLR